MATLTGQKIKDTYDGLLKTQNAETGLPTTGQTIVEDGRGIDSALSIGRASNGIKVTGDITADDNIVLNNNDSSKQIRGSVNGGAIQLTGNSDSVSSPTRGLFLGRSDNNGVFTSVIDIPTTSGTTGLAIKDRVIFNNNITVDGDAVVLGGNTSTDNLNVNTLSTLDNSSIDTADDIISTAAVKATQFNFTGSIKDNSNAITITKFVDEADGIDNNDNDTSIPTSAAIKDYVLANAGSQLNFDWLFTTEANGNTNQLRVDLRDTSGTVIREFAFLNTGAFNARILSSTGDMDCGHDMIIRNGDNADAALRVQGSQAISNSGGLYIGDGFSSNKFNGSRGGLQVGNNGQIKDSNFSGFIGTQNVIDESNNSFATGFDNTITDANASVAIGFQNDINGAAVTEDNTRSIAVGFANRVRGYSSVALGGNNDVFTGQNGFCFGFNNNLTTGGDNNFAIGESNTQLDSNANGIYMIGNGHQCEDGEMSLGYRNDRSVYPTTDFSKGLGETKVVIGCGSVNRETAMIITEGGVTRGGGVAQKPRIIFPSVTDYNYSSDTAAAAGGIPVGGLYHNSGDLKIRLT